MPPKILWLLRHFEIDAKHGACIGWMDIPLSDVPSASKAAKTLSESFGNIEHIYTSDLKRAVQSAELVANFSKCKFTSYGELREIDFGKWEGMTWSEIEADHPEEYRQFMDDWKVRPFPDGESYEELTRRVRKFYNETLSLDESNSVCIVGHGGSLPVLARIALAMYDDDVLEIKIDRGGAIGIDLINHKLLKDDG